MNLLKQMLLFGFQIPFSIILFDIPLFDKFKSFFLSLIFKIGKRSYVRKGTKFISSHARINGIGSLSICNNVLIKGQCEIDYSGGLKIEDNVRIAKGVMISTHGHDFKNKSVVTEAHIKFSKLEILKNATIGTSAIILDSVNKIGEGAVVGAGSVVIKDVPSYTVVMGNPARPVFKREDQTEK